MDVWADLQPLQLETFDDDGRRGNLSRGRNVACGRSEDEGREEIQKAVPPCSPGRGWEAGTVAECEARGSQPRAFPHWNSARASRRLATV